MAKINSCLGYHDFGATQNQAMCCPRVGPVEETKLRANKNSIGR